MYSRLDVRLTDGDYFGESYYNDQLQSVVDELDSLGLLRISDGAKCVFPQGFTSRDGSPLPLIVQKSDGGFGYAATDLATIRQSLNGSWGLGGQGCVVELTCWSDRAECAYSDS